MHRLLTVAVLAAVCCACGGSPRDEAGPAPSSAATSGETSLPADSSPGLDQGSSLPDSSVVPATRAPDRLPEPIGAVGGLGSGTPGVVGEVPDDLLAEILDDAAEQTGRPVEDFTVIRGEFVVWDDGSLGCYEPGVFFTQAPVDGYWVVLEAPGGDTLDYRATVAGSFKRCLPLKPINPTG